MDPMGVWYGWSFPFAADFPAIEPRISGEILQQLISKLNDPADFAGLASPLRGRGESGFRVPSYVSSSVPKPGKTYVTRWWSVLGTGFLMDIFQRRGRWCEKHLEKYRAHHDRVRGCWKYVYTLFGSPIFSGLDSQKWIGWWETWIRTPHKIWVSKILFPVDVSLTFWTSDLLQLGRSQVKNLTRRTHSVPGLDGGFGKSLWTFLDVLQSEFLGY